MCQPLAEGSARGLLPTYKDNQTWITVSEVPKSVIQQMPLQLVSVKTNYHHYRNASRSVISAISLLAKKQDRGANEALLLNTKPVGGGDNLNILVFGNELLLLLSVTALYQERCEVKFCPSTGRKKKC